ncbi:MAG: hypothetical protein IPL63_03235 [Saprospiraceae bacterium]|nr:hypothetical protein [Saprospiraceae bacterium]MBK8546420.1 hypothetical protein [Saprospiraceae bacterium]MBK8854483.1 hypothetical protein [Saprospiraceae bacterium]MBP6694092.1 hypothetical protein [Saprospiraceae bacterium]
MSEGNSNLPENNNQSLEPEAEFNNGDTRELTRVMEQLEYEVSTRSSRMESQFLSLPQEKFDKIMESDKIDRENAFKYHMAKLEADKEIDLKLIDKGNYTNETERSNWRYLLISILLITIIIIFQKPDYLPEWGALLMGSGGGFGLGYYKGKQSIEDTNVMPAEKE